MLAFRHIEKGHNHFEVLPEGWIKVSHNSGLPIYLHKQQRVCTVSKPYFLGPGSVRKHEIPITAIPCLNYRRALAKEADLKASVGDSASTTTSEANSKCDNEATEKCVANGIENGTTKDGVDETGDAIEPNGHHMDNTHGDSNESTPDVPPATENVEHMTTSPTPDEPTTENVPRPTNPLPGVLGTAKIETVTENTKAQSLTAQQINEYCKGLFVFKKLRVMRFK